MITIKQTIYDINPIEYNCDKDEYDWAPEKAKTWIGLSELNLVPSVFIEVDTVQIAIPIEDLQKLLSGSMVSEILASYEKPKSN